MKVDRIKTKDLSSTLSGAASDGKGFIAIFTAVWCGYCRTLERELDSAALEFKVVLVDVSNESDKGWDDYRIEVVPTALLFKGGQELGRKAAGSEGLRVKDLKALYESHG